METTIKKDERVGFRVLVPCKKCLTHTRHEIVSSIKEIVDEGDVSWWQITFFDVVRCLGCEEFSFLQESADANISSDEDAVIEIYPPRAVGRKHLESSHTLPFEVRRVYLETHKAFCSEMPILTAMGIRALTEAVCINKQTAGRNLEEKINDLVEKGFLSKQGSKVLHYVRQMANEAAHEIKVHDRKVLNMAMDVIEHLLTGVYMFGSLAPEASEDLKW